MEAIEACSALLRQAAAEGLGLEVLDIGGGFPVAYQGEALDIEAFCAPIRAALADTPEGIRLLAEPGRFISAPAMTSIASVMGKAERFGRTWYYLDDGLYGSYSGQLFDHVTYPKMAPYAQGELHPSVLAGPTCDSIDVIAEDILLPELEVGDLVVRITSYNVCYTKLLRLSAVPQGAQTSDSCGTLALTRAGAKTPTTTGCW